MLTASLVFVLGGCYNNSDSLATPTAPEVEASKAFMTLAKSESGVMNSATGSAHWRSIPEFGQTHVTYSFSAIRHANGSCSGEVRLIDQKKVFDGKAEVYDLKVSGNMAKLSYQFTRGNLAPDISKMHGYMVAIDNGEGANATDADHVTWMLLVEGTEIPGLTIPVLDAMDPETFLNTMRNDVLPLFGISYDRYLTAIDNGSVQVR
jgi:hypothetical protein